MTMQIDSLLTYKLKTSLQILTTPHGGGFMAITDGIPIYGFGQTTYEAIQKLRYELECLYNDLKDRKNLSSHWDSIRVYLDRAIEK